jgi:hypothetical protein
MTLKMAEGCVDGGVVVLKNVENVKKMSVGVVRDENKN